MANNRIRFSNDFILKDERVGINTTDPNATLDVNGTLNVSDISSFGSKIGLGTTQPLEDLDVRGNIILDGNLGVGKTNPSESIDVEGNAKVSGLTSTKDLYVSGISTLSILNVGLGGTVLTTLKSGNVGINTSMPISNLDVFGHTELDTVNISIAATIKKLNAGADGTAFIVTEDGNVGIGTTNPKEKLEVVGIVSAIGFLGDGTNLSGLIPNTIEDIDIDSIYYPLLSNVATGTISSIFVSSNTIVFNPKFGHLGIGTTNPTYKLQVVGDFAATTKSFSIPHPTKKGMTLRYGSLESPYHGIRLTGSSVVENGKCIVELPDYIHKLVKEEEVNIQLTNIRHGKVLWVESINIFHNNFMVMTDSVDDSYEFYWDFTAIRTDIDEMVVEY